MIKSTVQNINIGVDTGKSQLDIYVRPLDIFFSVSNDDKGIKQAIKTIQQHSPQCIVVEATGRLEMPFILACAEAGLPYVIANPIHVKRFAGAIGQRAKTDKLDAKLIAHYAEAIKPTLTQLKPECMRLMADLVMRRNQLLSMQSMPGIGKIAAASLISNLPELGYITNKQAAALVGVAPMNRESGRYKGLRKIQGGRAQVRTVLYMAMMSAMQCNPVFKSTYQRHLAEGKPKKVAIIACVRKMVVILNAMLRDGVRWAEKTA